MSATYTVHSGTLRAVVDLQDMAATAKEVALEALRRHCLHTDAPTHLSSILSVSGEQWSGDEEMIFSTVPLLRDLGLEYDE